MCRPLEFENVDEHKRFIEVVCSEAAGKILVGALVKMASEMVERYGFIQRH